MKKILMIILATFIMGCAHHPSPELLDNKKKAELAETYPITGISFAEFESLIRDIKEYIPPNAAILAIGIAKHNNVAYVMTGTIEGPLGGGGADYYFEKKEGNWKFLKRSIWIS